MSRRRIIVGLIAVAAIAVGCVAHDIVSTWRGIPDAYAAWDTGTLVVAYLESHDDQWPRSWDELLAVAAALEENQELRGVDGKDGFIYGDLRDRVAIDWNADPQAIAEVHWSDSKLPVRVVTRADGKDFPVVWEGAEPNEMIWRYLQQRDAE